MKNKLFILIMFLTTVLFISLKFISADTYSCSPTMKLVSQDPNPAIPDSYVKLVFEVSNLYNCNGYSVKLNPDYPFSLDPNSNPIQTIGGTPSLVGYTSDWMVPYKIRIAKDALEGDYELKLFYHEGSSSDFSTLATENDFNISIMDVQTSFAAVLQDVSGMQVSIGIVNTGKNTANSLIVSIPPQDNFRTTGTNEQIVGNLAAGDYSIVTFSLTPAFSRNSTRVGNNSANNQLLKVKMDYTDGIGERRNVTQEIPLNNLLSSGNLTLTGVTGFTRRNTSSGISKWWYAIIIVLAIVVTFLIYKGYHKVLINRIKNFYEKKGRGNGKNSKTAPNWVLAERTHKKK